MNRNGARLVLLGKVAGTHGIRGYLRVTPFAGESTTLVEHDKVLLKGPAGKEEEFAVATAAVHGGKVLFSLRGFDSINNVLHLVGREVYARREQLPPLPEGEYYHHQLLGLSVVDEAGQPLGKLGQILETGANDVYVVAGPDGKEILLPAVDEVILEVDLERGLVRVRPPEWQ